ncbi:unnamed protein product [Arctogadus glacialis]
MDALHSDVDAGDGRTRYTLEGEGVGSVFVVDGDTGNIHVTKALDREEKEQYRLVATATDRRSGRALEPSSEFLIRVQDINDNAPAFARGSYVATVTEMADMGTSIIQVTALDADDPSYGYSARLVYTVTHGQDAFSVDAQTGVLRTAVADMDRETQEEYLVVLEAKDMGGHQGGLSGTTTVTVTLADVNDNPPHFRRKSRAAERSRRRVDPRDATETRTWLSRSMSVRLDERWTGSCMGHEELGAEDEADLCEGDEADLCEGDEADLCEGDEADLCEEEEADLCEEDEADLCEEDEADLCEEEEADLCEEDEADLCEEDEADLCEEDEADLCEEDEADLCEGDEADLCEEEEADLCEGDEADLCEEEEADLCEEEEAGLGEEEEADLCEGDEADLCEEDEADLGEGDLGEEDEEDLGAWTFSVSELAAPGVEVGRLTASDPDLGVNAQLDFTLLDTDGAGDTFNLTARDRDP